MAPHAGSETKLMANQQRPNLLPRGPTETDLPAALRRDRIEAYRKQFCRDYNPTSFTERVIINDLARRAANMDLLENVADALQRQGALALIDVTLPLAENSGAIAEDVVLAGAVASGRIDECQRHSLGNARAFYRALDALRYIQANRRREAGVEPYGPDPRFATEADCTSYLLRRFEYGDQPCRRCGGRGGCWIAGRRCWECGNCGAQTGLRVGTVMERSALPLVKWFAAIRIVLLWPDVTTHDLSEKVGIKRGPTVRSVARRIRTAMASDNASKLLAGLDVVYSPAT